MKPEFGECSTCAKARGADGYWFTTNDTHLVWVLCKVCGKDRQVMKPGIHPSLEAK